MAPVCAHPQPLCAHEDMYSHLTRSCVRLGVCLWQCGRERVGEGEGVKGVYVNLAEMRPTLL